MLKLNFLHENVVITLWHDGFNVNCISDVSGGLNRRCAVVPFCPLSHSKGFSLFRLADFNDEA